MREHARVPCVESNGPAVRTTRTRVLKLNPAMGSSEDLATGDPSSAVVSRQYHMVVTTGGCQPATWDRSPVVCRRRSNPRPVCAYRHPRRCALVVDFERGEAPGHRSAASARRDDPRRSVSKRLAPN
jgi:hypothetical protein